MKSDFSLKKITIILITLAVVSVGVFLLFISTEEDDLLEEIIPEEAEEEVVEEEKVFFEQKVIGISVEGREIESFTYGNGDTHLLFVGGVHGGYEWNSVVLAYDFMDYFESNPEVIPNNLKVTIVPSANPDGVYKIIGKEGRFYAEDAPTEGSRAEGRFNANGVDLNRNFDCKWEPESTWQGRTVSAGSAPFSEPEAVAIRNLVLETEPRAAIFWHSRASAVYASECNEGVLPETIDVMNAYASASGYAPVESFDHYPITGDVEGWLASIGIPAVTVEMETHENVEWNRNLAGVKALFDYYGN